MSLTNFFALFPLLSIFLLSSESGQRRRGLGLAVLLSIASILWGYNYHLLLSGVIGSLTFLAVAIFQYPLRREILKAARSSMDRQIFLKGELSAIRDLCAKWEETQNRLAEKMEQIAKRYSFARSLVSHLEEKPILEDLSVLFSLEKTVVGFAFHPRNHPADENLPFFTSGWVSQEDWKKILEDSKSRLVPLPKGEFANFWNVPVKWNGQVRATLNFLTQGAPNKELMERTTVCAQLLGLGFQKAELHRLVVERGRRDGLTNFYLRRVFLERLSEEMSFSKRYGTSFSLLMIDLDHFKTVNDQYGHLAGDACLKSVAQILQSGLHHGVTISRYGGEEFAVLIGLAPAQEVMATAENLRKKLEETPIILPCGASIQMTISLGAAHFLPESPASEELIRRADAALYAAKQSGRNCVREWAGDLF